MRNPFRRRPNAILGQVGGPSLWDGPAVWSAPAQRLVVLDGERPAATVCSFVYDERPCVNLFRSLLRDIRDWPALEVWNQSKDALILRSRSVIATKFLDEGHGDVLVMLDHDIGWERGDLEHLINVCLQTGGVVGGIYPMRGFSAGTPLRATVGRDLRVGEDAAAEVDSIGTGFMAIHRTALERIRDHHRLRRTMHGFYLFFPVDLVDQGEALGPELLSEDYGFCRLARAAGVEVWADLKPLLTHFGSHQYRMVDSAVQLPPMGGMTIHTLSHFDPHPIRYGDTRAEVYVDPEDRYVSATILRGMQWEPEVTRILVELGTPGRTLVDLGAHIGVHTVLAAPHYAQVLAVEAMPETAALLARNVEHNGLTNVSVWSGAVWPEGEEPRMIRDEHNSGASHLAAGGRQGLVVDRVDLRELTARVPVGLDRAAVLKVDIEGADYHVFMQPEGQAFLTLFDVVVFEYCNAQSLDVSGVSALTYLALLRGLGFRICYLNGTEVDDEALPRGPEYLNLLGLR